MADFIGILKKALARHGDETSEKRVRIYESVRATLARKLAEFSPPIPASDKASQMLSLEDAISMVEGGYSNRAPETDPLAELEHISSSIDRNKQPAVAPDLADEFAKMESELASFGYQGLSQPQAQQPTITNLQPETGKPTQDGGKAHFSFGGPNRTLPISRQYPKPPEPQLSEGPQFELRDGKLAGTALPLGNFSEKAQSGLHQRLRATLAGSAANFAKLENKFPELVRAAREYTLLLEPNTSEIDIVSVYSVGASLLSFADAYREQNIDRTLAEPIEPQTAAALQAISRIHGAFIMGFEEGADLVRKSDEFLLDAQRIREIEAPGNTLLNSFVVNKKIIEAETIEINRPVADYVAHFGWTGSRAGYSAYIAVRNTVVSSTKILLGDLSILGVLGAAMTVSAYAGDPNMEFIRNAVPLLRSNATDLLAFFNHSPELRAYIEWVIDVLERDNNNRQ
ncbi:hypothetical protein EB230_20840 [Mesorhizobium sp. NZP2234]|uniref:hypothetical protein n=1 Tax=Mesorhizobium sp. NZP2234 TaxID=2483402 RepID=UPI00155465C4|nr:hypothetical protein [Mesorhizobium sp. NZP2234]QKC90576.1 hypothetical protein EB230_20840 [Mesorhizobium sp. NZP2234]